MQYDVTLLKGKLIKRYKRFMADIELENGSIITAHCTNSGSMKTVLEIGATVYVSPADNPKRKLKYTWEMIELNGQLVGINTSIPNKIGFEEISANNIPELAGYEIVKKEVKYGKNSRIDIYLEDPKLGIHYVEIKNVTLSYGNNLAEFPDSVTTRGTKHLHELIDMVKEGHKASMLYIIQRQDCHTFTTAKTIDPNYHQALLDAKKAGVNILAYDCKITPTSITLNNKINIDLT